MKIYDVIIVGAGIAGASSAYFLKQKGLEVLVLDRSGIAVVGGSAAAGAFVSPKIGQGSPLQTLTNEAFEFAKEFYRENFPEHFIQTGVIRIPKDEKDALKFTDYEKFNDSKRQWMTQEQLSKLGIHNAYDSFLFDEAGVCNAREMSQAMMRGIDFELYTVQRLVYEKNLWTIGQYRSKKLILATGYENSFFDMRYMGVKGTWGTRGDYATTLDLGFSMHKSISVSANINGMIRIGATHEKGVEVCMHCEEEPLKNLFTTASTMVDTSDFKLKETFCGMRSGSKDYFPLVGSVINVSEMLEKYPKLPTGVRLKEELIHIKNLYICNGLGGRGFVFAPMMGKMLAENIVDGQAIDQRVNPDRLFLKWCRKSPDLER